MEESLSNEFQVSSTVLYGENVTPFNLFYHQVDPLRWMINIEIEAADDESNLAGGINADKMGLGKTMVACALSEIKLKKRVLIVCGKTTIYQWFREALQVCRSSNIYTYKSGTKKIYRLYFVEGKTSEDELSIKEEVVPLSKVSKYAIFTRRKR